MSEEFCLSEKRNNIDDNFNVTYLEEDVKEFIKIVEAIMMDTRLSRREKIDRLHERAGEGLV